MVPKVRISLCACRPLPGAIRQATTVCLWTSSPQQRSLTTSIGKYPHSGGRAGCLLFTEFAVRASLTGATIGGGLTPFWWTFRMSRAETRENVHDDSAFETLIYTRVQST